MKVKCRAKVNLMLKVIEKLNNGYHNLQMLNMRIDLCDYIYIEKSSEFSVTFKNEEIDPSFIYKVINRLRECYNIKNKYDIVIEKHIPVGSGLGGASMNAAKIVDEILQLEGIDDIVLNKINNFKDLGADIAYGFYDSLAIVEGLGEKIYIIEKENIPSLVLVNPNILIKTKDVFEKNNVYTKKLSHNEIINSSDIYINDLEKAAFLVDNSLNILKQNLTKYGKVIMSGTGSSFLVHTDKIEQIKKEYPNYLVLKVN